MDRRLKAMALAAAAWLLSAVTFAAAGPDLPQGFVYLADVDPSIVQDIRYYGAHNFVGRRIEGYNAAECILTKEAASALSRVQAALAEAKLSLIVWDCYRPGRAVADFIAWSESRSKTGRKAEFFPNLDKKSLFAFGYIAAHSAHSRGSAVDIGLIPKGSAPGVFRPEAAAASCTAPKRLRFQDGALDFGTGFDCLDGTANLSAPGLSREARENRDILRKAMISGGFEPYAKEWWHFTLKSEPFPDKSFDFPIEGRHPR